MDNDIYGDRNNGVRYSLFCYAGDRDKTQADREGGWYLNIGERTGVVAETQAVRVTSPTLAAGM